MDESEFAYPVNYLRPGWPLRALLLDLDEWVTKGMEPPASRYPHLKGQLVPRGDVRFPRIPSVKFPPYLPGNWSLFFGPEFLISGIISNEPPQVGREYVVLVPQVDEDGNETGGIRLPDVSVPLGTFTGWNFELPLMPNLRYLAGLRGSFIAFARTSAERSAKGDPRLSLEERYHSRDEYLDRVRRSAEQLVSQRFLRAEDIAAILQESKERWDGVNLFH